MANNLPSVTSPLPRDLQVFIQRVREAIDGGGLDGLVTARQMVVAGLASFSNGVVTSTASPVEPPRPPTGLAGSGALASVIVSWDGPTYSGHSYTEIWAATQTSEQVSASQAPLASQAILVGMTAGDNFSHGIGSGATRYYWAKNVNRNGLASAFNATAGVSVTTGDDPEYLMDVLSSAIGGDSEAPFFQIDGATTINGVSIPAGTYIKAAFIADATITNAKIGSLTADKITASLLNTVDFYGNTIAGSEIFLGGTVSYSQTEGVNTSISSVSDPKIAMNSTGATFKVNAFKVDNGNSGTATPFQVVNNSVFIDSAVIKDAAITTAKIDDAAITTAKIQDANITTLKIADEQITATRSIAYTVPSADNRDVDQTFNLSFPHTADYVIILGVSRDIAGSFNLTDSAEQDFKLYIDGTLSARLAASPMVAVLNSNIRSHLQNINHTYDANGTLGTVPVRLTYTLTGPSGMGGGATSLRVSFQGAVK